MDDGRAVLYSSSYLRNKAVQHHSRFQGLQPLQHSTLDGLLADSLEGLVATVWSFRLTSKVLSIVGTRSWAITN